MDDQIIDWGVDYLLRRFPIVQLEADARIRNAVSDLMFIGKYGKHVEKGVVIGQNLEVHPSSERSL